MASEAQRRFLRRRYAQLKDEEKCCDCPGCDKCRGFVRNCTCDHDTEFLKKHQRTTPEEPAPVPEHVNREEYEEYGF